MTRSQSYWYLLGLLALVTCKDQPSAPSAVAITGAGSVVASAKTDYVATPAGWLHRSCVHPLPEGAQLNVTTRAVTLMDGTAYSLPACQYRSYRSSGTRNVAGSPSLRETAPGYVDWAEYTRDLVPLGDEYRTFSAMWLVPDKPESTYTGNSLMFLWPGLEDSLGVLLQPVLQYGYNGAGGRTYWSAASWYCDLTSPSSVCGPATYMDVYPGDTLWGYVSASNCSGILCDWTITTVDSTSKHKGRSVFSATRVPYDFRIGHGGVVEIHNVTSCAQFPVTGVFFFDIAMSTKNGFRTAKWADSVNSTIVPQCSFAVTSSSTSANMYFNPVDFTTSISNDSTSWFTARPYGGYPPYVSSYWEWCSYNCSGGNAPAPSGGVGPNRVAGGWQFFSTAWQIYFPYQTQVTLRSTVKDSHNQQAVETYFIP